MTGSILTMVYLLLLLPIYLLHKVLGCDHQDQVDRGKEGQEGRKEMFEVETKNSNIEI